MTIIVGIVCFIVGGLLGVLLSALCVMAAPTSTEQARDNWNEAVQCRLELARLQSQVRGALTFLRDGEIGDAEYVLAYAAGELEEGE